MSLEWAAEDSFYITLPSHDPGLRYVDTNTPARYSIALPEKLVLETNQWEVGMSEIFIPDYGYNIRSPREGSFKITYERVIQDEDGLNLDRVNAVDYIAILEGRYTAKTWVRAINERLKETVVDELTKENLFQGRLRYHEAGNQIEVVLGARESMTVTDPMLAHMTGWERADAEMFNGGNAKTRSFLPYPAKFDANGDQMLVYTNIIQYSTVGSENMPLLRTVYLDPGGMPCNRQFKQIQYHLLRMEEIDHIEILLKNSFGHDMDFKETGCHSVLVLHFRRRLRASGEK